MGQDRDGDFRMRPGRVQADLAQRPLYGRGSKLVKRGVGATPRVGGGKSAGSRDGTGSGSGQCLSLISFELVRGLTAVVYCRHTGGKASSPHKWGEAGYADHLGRLSVTRANRVQIDSLHAGEWVRVGYAARYGGCIGWLVARLVGCRLAGIRLVMPWVVSGSSL